MQIARVLACVDACRHAVGDLIDNGIESIINLNVYDSPKIHLSDHEFQKRFLGLAVVRKVDENGRVTYHGTLHEVEVFCLSNETKLTSVESVVVLQEKVIKNEC